MYQHKTEKDFTFNEAVALNLPDIFGCSFPGCDNIEVNKEYGYCDYHMMPIDGRDDPYRDSAYAIGDDV